MKKTLIGLGVAVLTAVSAALVATTPASAAAVATSTPSAPAGWSVDNRPGGAGDRVDPVYSGEQPRSGNGSLRFDTPAEESQVATYHALNGKLAAVNSLSFDWLKANTPVSGGSAGQSVSFVLWLDEDGDPSTADPAAMQWEPVYNGYGAPGNVLPTGAWQHSNLLADGTNCWGDTGECHTFQEFQTKTYPNATMTAFGFNQGTSNPSVVSYADNPEVNGVTTNFELDNTTTTVTVSPQATTSADYAVGNGNARVTAWVDIERTTKTTGSATTRSYRVRSHTRVAELNGIGSVQSDLSRLGTPTAVLTENTSPANGGALSQVDSVSPWVAVGAATACDNPVALRARGTGSARADNKVLRTGMTVLTPLTTSQVCLPAAR